MSGSNWNFSNNLGIPNNKYLKWLDSTGITCNNIIGLDAFSNLNINSGIGNNGRGDIYLNSNSDPSFTFINSNNLGSVLVSSKLAIGINNTSNINSTLVLPSNSWISVNNSDGFIGLTGSLNTTGSRVLIYGNNNTNVNSGSISIYTGNVTSGSFNVYTGNDSLKLQLLSSGNLNLSPNGSTIRLSVSDIMTIISNQTIITSTIESTSSNTGALQISGGVGIAGDTYIQGKLSIDSITGNLNFNNSTASTSYSSGTLRIDGGIGITCSTPATSPLSGGAISAAGGLALGSNAMIGGNITIYNSNISSSSQTGCIIGYGGMGINGQINIRTNTNSQIRIAPVNNGNETSLFFSSNNDYTTSGSWYIGQNVNGIGNGNFGFVGSSNGTFMILNSNSNNIVINKFTTIKNTLNFYQNSTSNFITFTSTSGNTNWSLGRDITTDNFQLSRYNTIGNFIGYVLTSDTTTGGIQLLGTENAISSGFGGALSISGGASILKDMYIGGNVYANSNLSLLGNLSALTSEFTYLILNSTNESINLSTGSIISNGGITIKCSRDASSFTEGGSLLIAGGAAIGSSMYIGTKLIVGTLITTPNLQVSNMSIANSIINNSIITNNSVTNSVITNMTLSNSNVSNINASFISVSNITSVNNTSSQFVSTNITTSSIIINNTLTAIGNSNTLGNIFTTNGNVGIGKTDPNAPLQISNAITNRTIVVYEDSNNDHQYHGFGVNPTSMRYQVSDVSGDHVFYAGVNSTTSNELFRIKGSGNVIIAGTSNSQAISTGNLYSTFASINNCNLTNITSTSIFITGQLSAMFNCNTIGNIFTTGGNVGISTTIPKYNLDVNGSFRGLANLSISDTVNNITNTIGSFNFSSDIALSNNNRNSILFNPVGISKPTKNTRSIGSKFILYPQIGSENVDYSIGIEQDNLWQSVPNYGQGFKWYQGTNEIMSISTIGNLIVSNSDISINSSTGSLISYGGISVNNSSNSLSTTFGGSLTLAGGASINKDLYIGGNILQANSAIGTISNLLIGSITDSSGIGSGGNLTVLGGSSISKKLYVGTQLAIGNSTTILPQQMLELSAVNFSSNQDSGMRISTKNPTSTTDTSYRYIDIRLKSSVTNVFRGSIVGTLGGGTDSENEFVSFSQDGNFYISNSTPTKFMNTIQANNSSMGSVVMNGGLAINAGFPSTSSSNGGSLTVNGGASISGDLIVGGTIIYGNTSSASSTLAYLTLTSTNQSLSLTDGSLITYGGISIQSLANAVDVSNGGGLTIAGGIAVAKDMIVGGKAIITYLESNITASNLSVSNEYVLNSNITHLTSQSIIITNGLNSSFNCNTIGNIFTTGGNLGINTTTPTANLTIINDNYPNLDIGSDSSSHLRFLGGCSDTYAYIQTGSSGTLGNLRLSQFNNNTGNINKLELYSNSTSISGILNINLTTDSINSTSGSIISYGGISISKTSNATSITSGGALTVAGGIAIGKDIFCGGTIVSSSDIRLKSNLIPLDSILDKIDNIRTIKYNHISDDTHKQHIGFIAQDFEEFFPELLSKDTLNIDSLYALDYTRVTVLLLKCIKELKQEIDLLKLK